MGPAIADLRRGHTHPNAVNRGIPGEGADGDRDVERPSVATVYIGEQERLALRLRDAAAKLPAHQRAQLRILVDGRRNRRQQACGIERRKMILHIVVAARLCVACGGIVHLPSSFGVFGGRMMMRMAGPGKR